MLPINLMPINYNISYMPNRKIDYIVIHDTGNRSIKAGVNAHYSYFNSGDKQSSADFFVDDSKIGQFNPNLKNYYTWDIGDGRGKFGNPPMKNNNSIGIELCINSDSNYEKTFQNGVELAAYLLKQNNLPIDRLIRHKDASDKNCPQTMNNNGDWSKWTEFKNKTNAILNPNATAPAVAPKYGVVTASVLNVRDGKSTSSNIIGTLKQGDKVKIGGVYGDWVDIYFGNHGGFVSKAYLKLQ